MSHNGTETFAWDFDLDQGHFVHAVVGGTVTMVREDRTVGGCSSDFGNAANYVVIDHGDGTGGLYLHFAPGSSPLSVGETVRAGDMIGRVGLTICTTKRRRSATAGTASPSWRRSMTTACRATA